MAFRFNWPEFDAAFYDEARSQLEAALNKGNKPKNIVDHITVKELHMGTSPPDLEILEVGDLATDKFRGIFKLTYAGDAYIVVQTKVQANPMHAKHTDLARHIRPGILAADKPLVVPMLLRISDLKLRGIVVLVVSKTKGITLVFKNDPLESIRVSSTFDSITSIRNFLQREIEKQLRNLFQEDLPVMIHNLSLRYLQKDTKDETASTTTTAAAGPPYSPRSMPDLRSPPPYMSPPPTFSDIYHPSHLPFDPLSVADLNDLYSRRFQALHDDELFSDDGMTSSLNGSSVNSATVVADMYAEDADVPWYVTEGPELPSTNTDDQPLVMAMDQEIVVDPSENGLAAKLAQLTSVNHTLSPFAYTIDHATFRSLPHIGKKVGPISRNKKIPRRRVIRLRMSAPPATTTTSSIQDPSSSTSIQ
ncbi:hypothetical protein O0I10_003802 [Lichtheimia ornata]|uniref:Mitochondrial distribution and morphology protein 34 n=1 Tax=Lichtheimia ornata TaxID=688661 RepID=A0AAD7V8Q5_9FUNG|nr:uncharacterized protein O0I10_003802 [Lichtheimia ornata]KAJ8660345.1 hypothetical protein O0I10_003802 [Lichtheimia ornata]